MNRLLENLSEEHTKEVEYYTLKMDGPNRSYDKRPIQYGFLLVKTFKDISGTDITNVVRSKQNRYNSRNFRGLNASNTTRHGYRYTV